MIFLSAPETQRLIDWPAAVTAIERAYATPVPASAVPGRTIAQVGESWLRCMPAITPSGRFLGTKQIVRTNGKVTYLITLFDRADASLAYVVDGLEITRLRTAATSVAAIRLMGCAEKMRLAILGSGLEAQTHAEAAITACDVASVAIYSPTARNREALALRLTRDFGVAARSTASVEEAVADASHVLAAARSYDETPILAAGQLSSDVLVVSIGSTIPKQRELDVSVINAARVIIGDDPVELENETGDMIAARRAGIDFKDRLYSLAQLARGDVPAQLIAPGGVRLFKSLGSALQDLTYAEQVVAAAEEQELGTRLPVALVEKSSLRAK